MEKYSKVINKWANNTDVTLSERQDLESFIKSSVKDFGSVSYTWGLSRGISMTDSELNSLQKGGIFAEGKLSSWTNRIGIAQSFARNNASELKTNKVVIRTKDPIPNAAKLKGVKKFDEGEVIVSSKSKFKIEKIKKTGSYTEVWVQPIKETESSITSRGAGSTMESGT